MTRVEETRERRCEGRREGRKEMRSWMKNIFFCPENHLEVNLFKMARGPQIYSLNGLNV